MLAFPMLHTSHSLRLYSISPDLSSLSIVLINSPLYAIHFYYLPVLLFLEAFGIHLSLEPSS